MAILEFFLLSSSGILASVAFGLAVPGASLVSAYADTGAGINWGALAFATVLLAVNIMSVFWKKIRGKGNRRSKPKKKSCIYSTRLGRGFFTAKKLFSSKFGMHGEFFMVKYSACEFLEFSVQGYSLYSKAGVLASWVWTIGAVIFTLSVATPIVVFTSCKYNRYEGSIPELLVLAEIAVDVFFLIFNIACSLPGSSLHYYQMLSAFNLEAAVGLTAWIISGLLELDAFSLLQIAVPYFMLAYMIQDIRGLEGTRTVDNLHGGDVERKSILGVKLVEVDRKAVAIKDTSAPAEADKEIREETETPAKAGASSSSSLPTPLAPAIPATTRPTTRTTTRASTTSTTAVAPVAPEAPVLLLQAPPGKRIHLCVLIVTIVVSLGAISSLIYTFNSQKEFCVAKWKADSFSDDPMEQLEPWCNKLVIYGDGVTGPKTCECRVLFAPSNSATSYDGNSTPVKRTVSLNANGTMIYSNLNLVNQTTSQFKIPTNIGKLEGVEVIIINNADLSGAIPASFEQLLKLRLIAMVYNSKLTGTLPNLSGMKSLNKVFIQFNSLSGHLPEDWGDIGDQLTRIHVSGNLLEGELPVSWSKLKGLRVIKADMNPLVTGDIPEEYSQLDDLWGVYLNGTGVNTTTVPLEMKQNGVLVG